MTEQEPSGWTVGAAAFAAFMMLMLGCWWLIAGIAALAQDGFYVATENYVLQFDTTTWGWVHLILGILTIIAGGTLFTGKVWARTFGVILAFIGTLVAFAWLPYYPFWAMLFIVAGVAVIWALTVHGRELAR
ncbi:hypothetical protein E3T26_05255 [Cryobacterium sp. TMT1-21]|uniref:DUF7144 domain-containing protein n=1 Tax=Cryobacterium shii TaxID=1259235 RepID=A0AAQ2C8A5_9MICO|nr:MULTISPECIES: hypothetical protein [Cryobacterium]TFC51718.1 hypothetical protein E3O49_03540 [Cryobacterium shii]TFC89414.1 hypothetical protein E3T24_00995 [Cryobacterium sp. TmT2-59]TFD13685.1 hypothetical protein E3T42_13550 [Cryobacterium sp. TMT4-10]TFD15952.1 hypothetical protein E3T26_05255 [Cryobacterium sp. TMT1-21]TFD19800.1 hypothetical protein E3T32_10355 [Cryobacterium sp. TMT2-23]